MKNIFSPHTYSGKTSRGRCEVRGGGEKSSKLGYSKKKAVMLAYVR